MSEKHIIDRDSARMDVMHTLAVLGRSQGMYGRLFRNISRSQYRNEILDNIIDNYGTDPLSIIMWAEDC